MNFVNGAEVARYGQAGVVTPDHNIRIKNKPLVVRRARGRRSRRFQERGPRRGRGLRRVLPGLFCPQQCARRRHQDHARSLAARGAGARRRPVRARPQQEGRGNSPPTWRKQRSPPSPMPKPSAASSRCRRPTCSMSNTGRWSRRSSAAPRSCRWRARSPSSPAPPARSASPPRRPSPRPAPKWRCSIVDEAAAQAKAKAIGGAALGIRCDVTDAASVKDAFAAVAVGLRRRRHRGLQCRRRLAGPDRRGRRGRAAREFRTEFLRPSARGAGRRQDHAGAGHRRLPAVQRLQAGGQSRTGFRPLRPAEGGDAVPGAAIRARSWRRRHPRQCRQCRPHPLRPLDRRDDRAALEDARRQRSTLHERQSARARSHGRGRGAGVSWRRRWR